MNKREFLEALARRASALSESEQARLTDYFSELIDDSMEAGVPEAEAVAALGDPAALVRELSPAEPAADGSARTVTALTGLRIRVSGADVQIRTAPIDNGAAAQLVFSDPTRFSWRADGGVMVIEELNAVPRLDLSGLRRLISSASLRATVTLAGPLDGALEFHGAGGDLEVEGLTLGGAATLSTASGDLRLERLNCAAVSVVTRSGDVELKEVNAASLRVECASGDIEGAKLYLKEALALETASGDVELNRIECGPLRVSTASGDLEIGRARAAATALRTASGDIQLDELEADPDLTVESASGDIELNRCIARRARLKSVSGDIDVKLAELPCGYDLSAKTRTGRISLPRDNPKAQTGQPRPDFNMQTTSGSIRAAIVP